MRKLFCVLSLLLFTGFVSAQETLKTVNLSNEFANSAGTPRVVRNGFKQVWLVVWKQGPKIVGKILKSDGTLQGLKTYATAVRNGFGDFDIFYDTVNYTYLLAFENSRGLMVQFINQNGIRSGPPVLIEAGTTDSSPRLAYDATEQKYLLFWLGSLDGLPGKILKVRTLDRKGKPLTDARQLAVAASGKTFDHLSVSTNQKNGNLIAMLLEKTSVNSSLLGYVVKPDGTLLKAKPLRFQPPTFGLETMGDAAFADSGIGVGFWSDRTAIKYRKISAAGGFASGTKLIVNAADPNSVFTSVLLDSRNNQFIGVWTQGNQVRAVALNSTSAAIVNQPFQVATSALGHARSAATSYDPSLGNALVVWEDSNVAGTAQGVGTKFRVRAALFFIAGAASQQGVQVGDNFFSPSTVTVKTGTTVKWTWVGNNPHTVTSGSPNANPGALFRSPILNKGATFTFRFTEEGRYEYFCEVHGAIMSGVIIVQKEKEGPGRY